MTNIAALHGEEQHAMPVQNESVGSTDMILSEKNFDRVVRFAELMSQAAVSVPQHLRGKPGDCLAVAMQSVQWGMNPFAVAQKTHFVNGAIGYEAQLVNAVVQQSGAIQGRFHYEYDGEGKSLACRVGAVIAGEREITWGEWLRVGDVTVQNSPLWKTNPRQQLGYLQVKNWARLYTPGAILGVYTADELQEVDMGPAELVEPRQPASRSRTESLKSSLKGSSQPAPEIQSVVSAMEQADTLQALDAAAEQARALTDEAAKQQAREAYRARRKQLEQPFVEPDTDAPEQDDFVAQYDANQKMF